MEKLSQIFELTHPRVFVRFGNTKSEIWVKNGDFQGDLFFFAGLGISHPTHPYFGKFFKKNFFLNDSPKGEYVF